jgi:hypothetical protein
MFRVGHSILESVLKAVGDFQTTVLLFVVLLLLTQSTVLLALRYVIYYTLFSAISSLLPALKSSRNAGKF